MKKLILKLLKHKCTDTAGYEPDKAKEWLMDLYENARTGFMHYYIRRERYLKDKLSSGIKGEEYDRFYGRLEELRDLQATAKSTYLATEKKK